MTKYVPKVRYLTASAAVTLILAAAVAGVSLLVSCGGGGTASSGGAAEKNLVLLVHGFQGSPENLRFLRDRLRGELPAGDWLVEEVTGLDPSYDTLSLAGPDANTRAVERFIEGRTGTSLSAVKRKGIFFLGHSMGGLTARQFSVWHREKTAKIFMLGTPNGGMNGLPDTSWASARRMNRSDGEADPAWIAWNRRHPAQADVEHYLFVGVCTNPAVSAIEGSPNDGLVGAWSVVALEEWNPAGAPIRKREFPDGHGVIPAPGCASTLLTDGAVAEAVIRNLTRGEW